MTDKILSTFDMPEEIYDFTFMHFNIHRKILSTIIRAWYKVDMIYLKELLFWEYDMIRYDDKEKFIKSNANPVSALVPLLVLRKWNWVEESSKTCWIWVELHLDDSPY